MTTILAIWLCTAAVWAVALFAAAVFLSLVDRIRVYWASRDLDMELAALCGEDDE